MADAISAIGSHGLEMIGPKKLSEIRKDLEEALAKDPAVLDRIEAESPGRLHPVVNALRKLLAEAPPKRNAKKSVKSKTTIGASRRAKASRK
jgi:hypothetical protein